MAPGPQQVRQGHEDDLLRAGRERPAGRYRLSEDAEITRAGCRAAERPFHTQFVSANGNQTIARLRARSQVLTISRSNFRLMVPARLSETRLPRVRLCQRFPRQQLQCGADRSLL